MSLHAWLDLALRWTHLVAGIAWIGSSFYFIWLDRHLEKAESGAPDRDAEGSLWMVHSGGFYRVERRRVGPGRMPRTLHWFKWEAAITWLTGFALLGLVYYSTRGLYLVDPAVSPIPPGLAAGLGLALLAIGWLAYDILWLRFGERSPALALGVSLVSMAAVAVGLVATFSGRAAYLHLGALLGTIMTANVWMRILPAQTAMIRATEAGQEPDLTNGERAKRRSVHNSYLTFPVLFTMVSGHFPGTFAGPHAAIVLLLLVAVGMLVRHLMIGSPRHRAWWAAPTVACAAAAVWLGAPTTASAPGTLDATTRAALAGEGEPPSFPEVQAVMTARCVACHSSAPRIAIYGAAPGGVNFEKAGEISRYSERILARTVLSRDMPLGNMTAMTDEERLLLARWIGHGGSER